MCLFNIQQALKAESPGGMRCLKQNSLGAAEIIRCRKEDGESKECNEQGPRYL